MQNPSQEPSASSDAPKKDLKAIDIRVCILKMGLSEVNTSLAVISTTAKLYWAFQILAYLYNSLASNLNQLIQG